MVCYTVPIRGFIFDKWYKDLLALFLQRCSIFAKIINLIQWYYYVWETI